MSNWVLLRVPIFNQRWTGILGLSELGKSVTKTILRRSGTTDQLAQ